MCVCTHTHTHTHTHTQYNNWKKGTVILEKQATNKASPIITPAKYQEEEFKLQNSGKSQQIPVEKMEQTVWRGQSG